LAAGRSTYEFGKVKYAPEILGKIHTRFGTPSNALLFNMFIGIIALLTGKTAEIITISVFGALTLYVISMIAVIQLRRKEPELMRPFRVPLYPISPIIALVIATAALIAMIIFNPLLAGIYALFMITAFTLFKILKR
jgi:ethanolamine permease